MTVNLPMSPIYTRTIFYGIGAQMLMTHEIKMPVMKSFAILFNSKASKLKKLGALWALWRVFQATKCLPEPTKANTWHPNTRNLIDLRDWLFQRCGLGTLRLHLIRRVMNFCIILYDFDPPWRWIFDSVREEALKKEWKPRGFEDTWVNTYYWWKE